jgi:nucleotide-binding universal stress UspA family protein
MLKKILVTLDSDKFAEYALAHVESIALPYGSKIILLRLFDSVSGKTQNRMVDPLDWHIRKMEVKANLNKLVERLRKKGLSVSAAVMEGSDAEQLIQYAQSHEIDLMILTKQLGTLSDLAHTVIKHATMPVVILPIGGHLLEAAKAADHYQKILVPLDGSQRAEITLPIAITLAQDCNAQLLLAHVVHKPEMPRHTPPNIEEVEVVERIVEINRADATRYLENRASRLRGDVQTRLLVSGNIAAGLHHLVEQERVDLIILSAHGYSGEPQQPYGSVTSNLIVYSTKPVLVVQDLPVAATQQVEMPAVARSGKAF